MLSVAELHQRGIAEMNFGRVRRARRLLERAVARAAGPQRARVQVSLAYALAELGEPEQAMRLCDEVLEDPVTPRLTWGIAEAQRAVLLLHFARTGEALEAFDRAVDRLDGASDLERGNVHLNRGALYLQLQRPADAERDFARAAELLGRAGVPEAEAKAEHNLGYARLLVGDLVGALAAMDRARPVLAPLSALHEATCDQDRAEVLFAAGQVGEAQAALEAAAEAYGRQRIRRGQAEAELVLARRLLSSDPAGAERWARVAARRFRRAGHEAWAERAEAVQVRAALARGARSDAVLARADELAVALRARRMDSAARSVELAAAQARVERGDVAGAVARVSSGRIRPSAPLDLRLQERGVRAALAAATGRPSDARRHLRAGLADLTDWQASFGSLDLQTNVVGQGVHLVARGLSLAVASRSPEVLFEWSERARVLASRVQPVRVPSDPRLAADLAELRASPAPEREVELRRRIREQAWQRAGSGQVAEPVPLEELRGRLGGLPGEPAVVSHVVADDRLVALAVTAGHVQRVDLGDRAGLDAELSGLLPDLDVAAGDLPGALGAAVRGELVARLGRLAQRLVEPVLPVVGDRPVVLTPSGVLAGVPWTLLPGFAGRPVTVAQSATSWLARQGSALRTSSAGLVAGPRVARAEAEVAAAAKEWRSARTLTGPAATAAAASALASEVDVLHLAAHGRHSAESPLFSGVRLADGAWSGYDVDQLERVPEVVLLSACEVGRSTVRWGEELIGMTTAWLHAGTRCVVASPASVADEAAYETLVAVHSGLAAGVPPAEALAAAVRAPAADRAPAPFVCFG